MAQKISAKYGKAAAIYSFNTLAHIEDMHAVLRGITTLLQPDGYLQFEIHYLGSVIDTTQYDMIYHAHQYDYSLLTLQKFFKQYQMEIFSVKKTPTHAGSLSVRVQFATTGTRRVDRSVATVLKEEKEKKYDAIATYRQVQTRIKQNRRSLLQLVKKLKQQGKHIVGYGASRRGTIISNYCHLDSRYLDYIIDDAPAKATVFTPGVQLHVYPSSILAQEHPDYILLFAWAFFDEIKQRIQKQCPQHKPIFILPLPQVKLTR